jgi:hypothetical protein
MSTVAVSRIPYLLADYINALEGDYSTREVAEDFLADMRLREPEELDAWLHEQALALIEITIGNSRRSRRARARRSAKLRAFSQAAESGEVSFYTEPFVIDEAMTLRPLCDMTAANCRFAATDFERSAKSDLLMAEFLKQIAKKAGRKTVGEVLSAEQVDRIAARIFH